MQGGATKLRIAAALIAGWTGIAIAALLLFNPQFAYVAGCHGRMVPPHPTDSPECLAAQPANLQPAVGVVIVVGYLVIVSVALLVASRSQRATAEPSE